MGVSGAADTAGVRCSHSWQADCLLGSTTVGRQAAPGADPGADHEADVSWHAALEWLERCRYLGQQLINHLVYCGMLGCNTVGWQADYGADHATSVSWHAALGWLERCCYLSQQVVNDLIHCSVLRFTAHQGNCHCSESITDGVSCIVSWKAALHWLEGR